MFYSWKKSIFAPHIFIHFSKQPYTVEEKIIDEARQGEYLMLPDSVGEQSTNKPVRKLLLESYDYQMNFSDSEIVASIMAKEGFTTTRDPEEADLVLLNTCAIRDNAELRIRG